MAVCDFDIIYYKKRKVKRERDLVANIISTYFHKLVDNMNNTKQDLFLEHKSPCAFYFELLERGRGRSLLSVTMATT